MYNTNPSMNMNPNPTMSSMSMMNSMNNPMLSMGMNSNNQANLNQNSYSGMNNNSMGMMNNGMMNNMGMMSNNMGMMNNTLTNSGNQMPASMSTNPLGLTAISGGQNNQRGSSVDGLVDQTYLQLSGEAQQITQKWRELQYDATDLQKKKVDLRRQWNEHRRNVAALQDEQRRFKEVSQAGFAPKGAEMRVRLNVGGQMFETTASTLTRDAGSMLDALCRDDSPLAQINAAATTASEKEDESSSKTDDNNNNNNNSSSNTVGVVFIDRDGKLFRYVLNFLRDGVLPQDKVVLRSLYREAKYYEIKSLCIEIEKRLGIVALLEPRTGSTSGLGNPLSNGNQQWWERPSDHRGWWPSQKRGQADMSWWTGEQYRGQSTTNVLRSYDANGVGTSTRDGTYGSSSSRYGNELYGSRNNNTLRDVDQMSSTWDSMGRGLSRRPYDAMDRSNTSGGGGMSSSYNNNRGGNRSEVGRYSGLRASGGSTRFR